MSDFIVNTITAAEEAAAAKELNPLYAATYGNPFDVEPNTDEFAAQVRKVQRIFCNSVPEMIVDGIYGPVTNAVMSAKKSIIDSPVDYIIMGGERKAVRGFPVIDFSEKKEGALSFVDFPGTFHVRKDEHDIRRITIHWDVCKTALSCFNVLRKRGYSTHFSINYDGTLYQWLDPIRYRAIHNGDDNAHSIGVDFNNPVDVAYFDWCHSVKYDRPILKREDYDGFGKGKFLGPTSAQIATAKKFFPWLCEQLNIPVGIPQECYGICNDITQNHDRRGVFCHLNYPVSRMKWGKWDFLGMWEYGII